MQKSNYFFTPHLETPRPKLPYPKAASTTWMVAFAKNNQVANYVELKDILHQTLKNAIDSELLLLKKGTNDTFTFRFIRHPFHRIVSNRNYLPSAQ